MYIVHWIYIHIFHLYLLDYIISLAQLDNLNVSLSEFMA